MSEQQCFVDVYPHTAFTQPATLLPVSQVDTSAAPVHARSCVHAPGPDVVPAPHLLLVHVWPLGHTPHVSVPPQPSEIDPQVAPASEHVVGVQPVAQAATGFCVGVGQSL